MKKILKKIRRKINNIIKIITQFSLFYNEYGFAAAFTKLKKELRLISSENYVSFMYLSFEKEFASIVDEHNNVLKEMISNSRLNGKKTETIPIWVCWFQGKDYIPELCQACLNRIAELKPANADIVFLTNENYLDYVNLPDSIIQKYNEGIIGGAHFSDIIRHYLISTYGGLWIDAAIFLSNDILNKIFERDFFTPKFSDGRKFNGDASRGLWCNGFWFSKDPNSISKCIYDCLISFWENHNIALDYLFLDYILMLIYNKKDSVKELIDEIPITTEHCRELNYNLMNPYSDELWNSIMDKSDIHLLNRHRDYTVKTNKGNKTIYGHMLEISGVIN